MLELNARPMMEKRSYQVQICIHNMYMANGNDNRSKLYTYTYYTIEKLSGTHVHVCNNIINIMVNENDNCSKLCTYTYIMGSGCFLTSGPHQSYHT